MWLSLGKPSMLATFQPIFPSLKSNTSVTAGYKLCTVMAKWSSYISFVKQMKIAERMCVLHSFTWNCVKYANMEGFCRDDIYYPLKHDDIAS